MSDEELIARLRVAARRRDEFEAVNLASVSADLITALLAQNAAQEARIEAMDAQYVEILGHAKAQKDRAEAAEAKVAALEAHIDATDAAWCARIAALEAQVENMREALDGLLDAISATHENGDRKLTITAPTANLKWLLEAEDDARAAITEETHE